MHHERNVAADRKGDKFIPVEVVEDTGTGSEELSTVQYTTTATKGLTFFSTMDKSSKSVTGNSRCAVGQPSNPLMNNGQEDGIVDGDTRGIPGIQGSPELRRKISRTLAVRDDARKLKTATLERMGKIFRLKSTQASPGSDDAQRELESINAKDTRADEQSRKDKANSLGRMFKLVVKNGEPRKLFPQSRTGSLSRILRRKSTGGNEDNCTGRENNPGVLSRMLNQWRNRSGNNNTTTEPNLCPSMVQENKNLSADPLTTSGINYSSSSVDPSEAPSLPATTISCEENSSKV